MKTESGWYVYHAEMAAAKTQSKVKGEKAPYVEPEDHDVEIVGHGGYCCGINHIYGFDGIDMGDWQDAMGRKPTLQDKLRFLSNRLGTQPAICFEAALADYQWQDWHTALLRFGFKRVTEFINGNTGRKIRIYHYYTPIAKPKKEEKDKKKPW